MFKKTILAICLAATSLPSLADSSSDLTTIIDNHWENSKAESQRKAGSSAADDQNVMYMFAGHAKP